MPENKNKDMIGEKALVTVRNRNRQSTEARQETLLYHYSSNTSFFAIEGILKLKHQQ